MEYFGQKLKGFCFTEAGWVQSYGSRYVRPPIIYADVSRPAAMTVKEFKVAQSLTQKPVKGMLTGGAPVLVWGQFLCLCGAPDSRAKLALVDTGACFAACLLTLCVNPCRPCDHPELVVPSQGPVPPGAGLPAGTGAPGGGG